MCNQVFNRSTSKWPQIINKIKEKENSPGNGKVKNFRLRKKISSLNFFLASHWVGRRSLKNLAPLYKMSSNSKVSAEALSCKGEKTRGIGPLFSRPS